MTAGAFTEDSGWRSGDAGRVDEREHLVYLERVSELVGRCAAEPSRSVG